MTPSAPPPRRQRRVRRWLFVAVAALVLALLLLALGAYFLVRFLLSSSAPARVAETVLAAATGQPAHVESLDLRLGESVAIATGIAIGDALTARSARLAFEPDSLARGRVPRLLSVDLEGAVVVLSETTVPEIARLARRLADASRRSSTGAASADRPVVRATDATLRVERRGRSVDVAPVDVSTTAAGTVTLAARGAGLEISADASSGEGLHARLAYAGDRGGPVDGAWAGLAGAPLAAIPESIDAEVDARPAGAGEPGSFTVSARVRARLARSPLTEAPADVVVEVDARTVGSGRVDVERLAVDGLLDAPLVARGSADLEAGRVEIASAAPARVPVPRRSGAAVVLDAWSVVWRAPGAVRASATARAEGFGPAIDGTRLAVEASAPDADAEVALTFEATAPIPERAIAAGDEPLPDPEPVRPEPLRVAGRARLSRGDGRAHLDAAEIAWPGVGSANADGSIDWKNRRLERLRVDVAREVALADVARELKRLSLLPPGASLGGSARAVAEIAGLDLAAAGTTAPERFSLLAVAHGVEFSGTPRGGAPIAGEKLVLSAALVAERDAATGALRGRLAGDAGNVVVLSGDRLVDLEGHVLAFDVPFVADADRRTLAVEEARLSGGDLGKIRGSATLLLGADGAPPRVEADVELSQVSLWALFQKTVLADSGARFPSLAATAIRGDAGARARIVVGPDGFRADGEATVEDAGATGPGFTLDGVSCRIPIALGRTDAGPRPGFVRVGSATVRGVSADDLALSLLFARDRALLVEPATVSVLGGEIRIEELRASSPTDAEAIVRVQSLDAARVGHALDSPLALAGTVDTDGALVVRARPGSIDAAGSLVARVLGGEVLLGGLRVDEPYSSVPRFRFDAEAVGLDLEKVTAALAYGEITGDFNGEARDVVIALGSPERFTARFEARATEGRPSKASVKAIRELPFLASEGRLTLQGIVFDAINSFGYERFGAVAALDDGVLDLHGRYRKDGADLYPGPLVAPLPPSGEKIEYAFVGRGIPVLNILVEPPSRPLQYVDFVRQVMSARQSRLE